MINPAVTVLMPVYNAEKFLREAIDSVLNQSLKDFEFLIFDDGSTDGSSKIIRSYSDHRINFIQRQHNRGLITTLNTGLDMAKGRYIARMDADDICHKDRLAIQLEFMENHRDITVCGTWFRMIPSGSVVSHPTGHSEIRSALLSYCALGHPTAMLRASVLSAMSLRYNESFIAAEDYELWTRIAAKGRLANLPHVLLQYREHDGQVSARMQETQRLNSGRCKVSMLCLPLPFVTEEDKQQASLTLAPEQISTFDTLNKVLTWLEKLSTANKEALIYDEFDLYLGSKSALLISFFFRSRVRRYNPVIFFQFIGLYRKHKPETSFSDLSRLFLKCFSFYRPKPVLHV